MASTMVTSAGGAQRSAVILLLVAVIAPIGAGHEQGQAQKGAALLGIGNAQEVLRERRPDG